MKIDLKFTKTEFSAIATICLKEANIKNFKFILNNSLKIEEISCNKLKVNWGKTGEIQPTFRSLSQNIDVSSEENISEIVIKYSGTVSTWHNVITDEIKALSWYSVWYPQEIFIDSTFDEVYIHDCSDYFIVKGVYDTNTKVWRYGGCGYDPYNIIAYKKSVLKTMSNPYLNIFYVDDIIEKTAKTAEFFYRDVLDFYNGELFDKKDIATLDVACLSPAITYGGAYKRKDLIVSITLGENDLETGWMTSHEMAHLWCSGANCDSWEDWLNETTAEWSSLLYAINRSNMELFDFILKPKIESYNSLPAIKTLDGSRPEGVHNKGTVLFYDIYIRYGVETIRKIVQLFVKLEAKTTQNFLEEIKIKISPDIALFIENRIEKQ